jgi:MoCo/4Fe-4S cofactor protein with predicted Tat translocation signal
MQRSLTEARMAALENRKADGWRGLEELMETPEFREALRREFPAGAAELDEGMTRRGFLQLLGASIALAGLGGCMERPREKILPYVSQPELTPGVPQHYATTMTLDGYGTGLLIESHEGRPTKVEGNPEHPASLGAAGVYQQASLLQLYDPQRARRVREGTKWSTWDAFARRVAPVRLRDLIGARGAGLRVLLEPTASPLLAGLIARVRDRYPESRFCYYAPLAAFPAVEAGMVAFGEPLHPLFNFRAADVALALDADFLAATPFHLRHARHFAERRRPAGPTGAMNRLYVVEPVLSVTGSIADHRLRVRAREVETVAGALLAELVFTLERRPAGMPRALDSVLARYRQQDPQARWTAAVARDLEASAGRGIVIAGDDQPPRVQLLAYLLNAALANVGHTVTYTTCPLLETGNTSYRLDSLVGDMREGAVHALVMLETNPVYTAPADLDFVAALRRVPLTLCHGLYQNETGRAASWFLPAAHYLESWGDARAYDGTASLVQPLIAPLFGGSTTSEVLALLLGEGVRTAHDLVREQWGSQVAPDFETFWDQALQRGVIDNSAALARTPALRWDAVAPLLGDGGSRDDAEQLEVVFRRDPSVHDGRFANNAWLQELPDPMTKLTWDNAALLSPATAARLRAGTGDVLRLRYRGRELRAPAYVLPGQADDTVLLALGYGRGEGDEALAQGVGFDAYRLWSWETPFFGSGLLAERVPGSHSLATTQTHWALEGRPIALHATLAEYREHPDFTARERTRALSLYQPPRGNGDQWAMTIDLSACTGCSACVVACQAENNVPVVGKEGVLQSREMHWLRIDRYFTGEANDPEIVQQPMLCQHCEKAPCEYVCPVNATAHSPDGLNEMIYNRCVGTRFCSNNCPYKVRRFNWFDYNAELAETERMAKNPEVTVRARGVMEKCTFCVQRIRRTQIEARIEGRPVRDGEVKTACQQACPTQAIIFGSLSDPKAEVVRRRAEPRAYAVLHELGTEPRVQYLARITNPNPAVDALSNGG